MRIPGLPHPVLVATPYLLTVYMVVAGYFYASWSISWSLAAGAAYAALALLLRWALEGFARSMGVQGLEELTGKLLSEAVANPDPAALSHALERTEEGGDLHADMRRLEVNSAVEGGVGSLLVRFAASGICLLLLLVGVLSTMLFVPVYVALPAVLLNSAWLIANLRALMARLDVLLMQLDMLDGDKES